MTASTTEARLRKLAASYYHVAPARVTDATAFARDLDADSLSAVMFCMTVEEEFGVEITDDEAVAAIDQGTFADLRQLLDGKLAQKMTVTP